MKLAITICRPCHPKSLYEYTGNIESVYKTHIVDIHDLPAEVISAIEEKEGCGCVANLSFVKED